VYTVLIDKEKEKAFAPLLDPCFHDSLSDPDMVAIGVADEDDTAAGALLAWLRSGWLEIGWIYVAPEFRGRGMGKRLLGDIELSAGRRPEISGVFAEYPNRPEDDGLNRMFRMTGFVTEELHKPFYIFKLDELEKNPLWQKKSENPNVVPLGRTDRGILKAFTSLLAETEQPVAVALPIDWQSYHQSLSVVYVRNGMAGGVLLFRESGGILDLAYAHTLPGNGDAMGFMLRQAGLAALESYPGTTPVNVVTVNAAGEAIVERLFPDLAKMPIRRAVFPFRH
jgi:GNAT superfamily N-acetyltransferase